MHVKRAPLRRSSDDRARAYRPAGERGNPARWGALRALLADEGFRSVAATGFEAPGVGVVDTEDDSSAAAPSAPRDGRTRPACRCGMTNRPTSGPSAAVRSGSTCCTTSTACSLASRRRSTASARAARVPEPAQSRVQRSRRAGAVRPASSSIANAASRTARRYRRSSGAPSAQPSRNGTHSERGGRTSATAACSSWSATVEIPARSSSSATSPTDWLHSGQVGTRRATSTWSVVSSSAA